MARPQGSPLARGQDHQDRNLIRSALARLLLGRRRNPLPSDPSHAEFRRSRRESVRRPCRDVDLHRADLAAGRGRRHEKVEAARSRAALLPVRLRWLARRLDGRRDQAFALSPLAGEFARPADGFRLLPRTLFRRLFIVDVPLHFAERPFALHLLLQGFERLVDVIVAHENLNDGSILL